MASTAIGREATRVSTCRDGRAGPDREHGRRVRFSVIVVTTDVHQSTSTSIPTQCAAPQFAPHPTSTGKGTDSGTAFCM
jgi:hypothetical protein